MLIYTSRGQKVDTPPLNSHINSIISNVRIFMSIKLSKQCMLMQSAHDREQIIIWLGSLCILYCLTRLWIAYWATQRSYNISWAVWRSRVPNTSQTPLCTAEVHPIPPSECSRRNHIVPERTRVFPKEPECPRRNHITYLGAGQPHPIH